MKPHQHAAFFGHMAHRQPGTVAIAPGGAVNWWQNHFRLNPANMAQVVFQHALLVGHLGRKFHMLHRAAATHAKVRAARRRAHEAGVEHLFGVGVFVAGFLPIAAVGDGFVRQRAVDKQGFAVDVGHPPAFKVQGFDTGNGLWMCHAGEKT